MASAPYDLSFSRTDDETFGFSISPSMADGTDFPFDDYAYEYVLTHCGGTRLHLTPGDGITVIPPIIEFKSDEKLRPGSYEHGFRIKHTETGEQIQIFSGVITITEGGF